VFLFAFATSKLSRRDGDGPRRILANDEKLTVGRHSVEHGVLSDERPEVGREVPERVALARGGRRSFESERFPPTAAGLSERL